MITMAAKALYNPPVMGHWDLAVIGAGPAGFGAAVAAGRSGMKVILIEKAGRPGADRPAMFFGFDADGKQIVGGIPDEVVRRLDAEGYASLIPHGDYYIPDHARIGNRPLNGKVRFNYAALAVIYNRMLREANVDCLYYSHVTDAVVEDGIVRSIYVSCLEGMVQIEADSFVDASGDAYLFRAAGAPVRHYGNDRNMHKTMTFTVSNVMPIDREFVEAYYHKLFEEGKTPSDVLESFGMSFGDLAGVAYIGTNKATGDAVDSRDMTRMDIELREKALEMVDFLRREMPGFQYCQLVGTKERVGVRSGAGIVGLETIDRELIDKEGYTDEPIVLIRRSYGFHSNDKRMAASFFTKLPGTSAVPMKALISPALRNVVAAGRCLSSDGYTMGTFRMMSTCMATGVSAAHMTKLRIQNDTDYDGVPYSELRPILDRDGFILP